MATLVAQEIARAGLSPAFAAVAGGGDKFLNDGDVYIEIINGDASPKTLTIVSQSTVDGLAVADRTVTIPAGERRKVGPFQESVYNDADGFVNLTYSAATSVTIGIFKLG